MVNYKWPGCGARGVILLFAALFSALALPGPSSGESRKYNFDFTVFLPEDAAKPVVVGHCAMCHSLVQVIRGRKDYDEWTKTVQQMIKNGATITSGDVEPIARYLSAYFTPEREHLMLPINLNTAAPESIRQITSIADRVDDIVKVRSAKPFETPEDILKINGITQETYQKIRPFISVKDR